MDDSDGDLYLKTKRERSAYQKKWYSDHINQHKSNQKRWHRERKQKVVDYYGGRCVCCGETEIEFLAIDHINNDGAAHRRTQNLSGGHMYIWLIKNSFPEGFQLLCHNCNFSKHFGNGVCVHKRGVLEK